VEAHPDADRVVLRPALRRERGLRRCSGRDGCGHAAEDGEEGVALAVDLDPAGGRERVLEQSVVRRQDVAVAVAAERLQQARRALDVGEQEGDGAGRQLVLRSFAQVSTR
jgi:hypothetical protein